MNVKLLALGLFLAEKTEFCTENVEYAFIFLLCGFVETLAKENTCLRN